MTKVIMMVLQGAVLVKPFGAQAERDYEQGYIQGALKAIEHLTQEVTE